MIRIAIAKGRGLEKCVNLLDNAEAYNCIIEEDKLYYKDDMSNIEVIVVRGADLAYAAKNDYVDIAIGSQLLFAENIINKMVFMNALHIGQCRLSLIGKREQNLQSVKVVGTRYPKLTVGKLSKLNIHAELIKLSGCLESWLLNDSCDAIVDVIQTGNTLKLYNIKEMVRLGPLSHGIWLNQDKNQFAPFVKKLKLRDQYLNQETCS